MKLPKVINAVLCEDMRLEFSGKFSLAGVFGSHVSAVDLSRPMVFGVFAEIEPAEIGKAQVAVRVVDSSGLVAFEVAMAMNFTSLHKQPITVGPFPFIVKNFGKVSFQWNADNTKWATIKSFEVNELNPENLKEAPRVAKKNVEDYWMSIISNLKVS